MKTLSAALAAALLAGGPAASVADPASDGPARALCAKNGATVTTETLANGAARAVCTFPDGTRIAAETYFRNKHRTR